MPLDCRLIHTVGFHEHMFCPTNLDIDKFQDSIEVMPILGMLQWGFPLGLVTISQLCQNLGLNGLY